MEEGVAWVFQNSLTKCREFIDYFVRITLFFWFKKKHSCFFLSNKDGGRGGRGQEHPLYLVRGVDLVLEEIHDGF